MYMYYIWNGILGYFIKKGPLQFSILTRTLFWNPLFYTAFLDFLNDINNPPPPSKKKVRFLKNVPFEKKIENGSLQEIVWLTID